MSLSVTVALTRDPSPVLTDLPTQLNGIQEGLLVAEILRWLDFGMGDASHHTKSPGSPNSQ